MTAHRISSGVLIEGPTLRLVLRVMDRGARDIFRTDGLPPSPAVTHVLRELERAIAETTSDGGTGELPRVAAPSPLVSQQSEQQLITTREAAALLKITPRQVRNLADRLGGQKVAGVVTLDRTAVELEAQRRREVAA